MDGAILNLPSNQQQPPRPILTPRDILRSQSGKLEGTGEALAASKSLQRAMQRGNQPEFPEQVIKFELEHISTAIQSSRDILELKDDWDEEGSRGYTEAVWNRAVRFLLRHAEWLWETYDVRMEAPRILPGPHGSIDLHWKNKSYELLINIPADFDKPASFYGDDYGSVSIKGTLDPSTYNHGLLLWLTDKR